MCDVTALIQPDERYRLFQKKTITAAVNIAAGDNITRDKITFLRNMSLPGLPPTRANDICGRKANRNIAQFEQIQLNDLD